MTWLFKKTLCKILFDCFKSYIIRFWFIRAKISHCFPVVSSGLCLPSDCVDSIEPRTQLQDTGPRRGRTVFTAQQLQVLERVFATTQYIVGSQRKFLANQLRLSETQVRVWFQNRRIKWRKQMLTRSING